MRFVHILVALIILFIPLFFYKKVLDTNQRLVETNTSLLKQIQNKDQEILSCQGKLSTPVKELPSTEEIL